MSIAIFFGFFSYLLLAIWSIPIGLKWVAYFATRAAVGFGPLSMTWANEICSADAEERALVLGLMNSVGYAFDAWVPLLTYPVEDAPRFKKGFIFSTCAYVALLGITGLISVLRRWESQKEERSGQSASITGQDIWEEE